MQAHRYPRILSRPDGSTVTIVNEICRCGHFRTQHNPTDGPAFGQGACATMVCSCGMFSWKGLILGGLSDDSDRFVASIGPVSSWTGEADRALRDYEEMMDRVESAENLVADLEVRFEKEKCKVHQIKAHADNLALELAKFRWPYVICESRFRSILLDP